ncbi:hypothetical protein JD969_11040 [Planctomycetota bacterium]|nr:hypothetical protein JD969_11040 [Planctomycetota bacterium]
MILIAGLIVLGLLAVVGLVLFVKGHRGVKVDDHAHCGGCGYDLSGMSKDMKVEENRVGEVCAECGAALDGGKGAVWNGKWEKRSGMLMGGMGLMLPMVVVVCVWGWSSSRDVDWNQYKPNRWLVWEVVHPRMSGDVKAVMNEILQREALGEIDLTKYEGLGESILALGDDEGLEWEDVWGDLLVRLHEREGLSERARQQWVALLSRDWGIVMQEKMGLESLDQVLVWVKSINNDRAGGVSMSNSPGGRPTFKLEVVEMSVDGEVIGVLEGLELSRSPMRPDYCHVKLEGWEQTHDELKDIYLRRGEEANHELEVRLSVKMFDGEQGLDFEDEVVLRSGEFRLLDGVVGSKLVKDEGKRDAVKREVMPCSLGAVETSGQFINNSEYIVTPYTKHLMDQVEGRAFVEPDNTTWDGSRSRFETINAHVVYVWEQETKETQLYFSQFIGFKGVGMPFCYKPIIRIDGEEYEQSGRVTGEGSIHTYEWVRKEYAKNAAVVWKDEPMRLPREVMAKHGMRGMRADLILRADPVYAYNAEHMDEIVGGDVVYEDVLLLFVREQEMRDAKMYGTRGYGTRGEETDGFISERVKRLLVKEDEFESVAVLEAYVDGKRKDRGDVSED